MEERSLVRQLLDPQADTGPTPGERRGFGAVPWGWADMIIVGALATAVEIALVPAGIVGAGRLAGAVSSDALIAFFLQVSASYAIIVGAVWAIGVRRHHAGLEALGFRPLDLHSLAGLLGLLAAVIVATNLAVGLVARIPRGQEVFAFGTGPRQILVMGLLVLVAAPLGEETFFRGFLLQGLARRLRFWPAAVITSALFALAHVWWQLYVPIFILGLAFAWLFWRTGSIWAPIGAHATINGVSFLLALLFGR
ncbi:MAG: hypothetical protein Kow00122_03910 [Thermoleophilia bacterium]